MNINWEGIGNIAKDIASDAAKYQAAEAKTCGVVVLAICGLLAITSITTSIEQEIRARRRHKEEVEIEKLRAEKYNHLQGD